MLSHLWDSFVGVLIAIFLPLICLYHSICGNVFLNTSVENGTAMEKVGNTLLIPFQYLFAGKQATQDAQGHWVLKQRFAYDEYLLIKSAGSVLTLPWSLVLGTSIKALSLSDHQAQARYVSLVEHIQSTKVSPNTTLYEQMGLQIQNPADILSMECQNYERRPGDELHLQKAKEGLKAIGNILTEANIPWWIDCGTLLGTYRYGGVIPWDNDIDISLLLPDFENAKRALNRLDSNAYIVQDWSGRDFPDTFLKVYLKETGDLIDIYFYDIDPAKQECTYIFSLDHSIFFFNWWKEGERRFTKPVAFSDLFPLKKGMFDGIEVFVPQNPIPFLQRYYGENLSPVKIYDPQTGLFEKDLSHPYWKNPYVH